MRKPLVAGNWKMNGSEATARSLINGITSGIDAVQFTEVAVCPPFVYLSEARSLLENAAISLGAQNVSHYKEGAYTGEISAGMLVDSGCEYVILGHSERRTLFAEDDALVAEKVIVAHDAGLKPMLCVGEVLEEREADKTEQVVGRQLDALLSSPQGVAALSHAVIAYEPVWAIGTGKTATPEQAQQVHAFIRQRIAEKDGALADRIRILYGGSVKPDNASQIFAMPDIDGGLIGGASLDAESFLTICKSVKAV